MAISRIIRRLAQGPAGPNSISANTSSSLTGVLFGDGSTVSALGATASPGSGDAGNVALFASGGRLQTGSALLILSGAGGIYTLLGPPSVQNVNLNFPSTNGTLALLSQSVRPDAAQSLTEEQQRQARANIGAVKVVRLTTAEYDALSPEEQDDETILYITTD